MEPKKTSLTIEAAGEKAIQKWPSEYGSLSPAQAGQKFLQQNPHNWEYVSDGAVAQHLTNLKDPRHKQTSGIFAFFGKMGEKQRAEYFERRVQTAKSLVALEEASAQIHHIEIESQLKVATTAQAVAAAKYAIHKLGLDAHRGEVAAEKGQSIETYDALNLQSGVSAITRQDTEHVHGLQSKTLDQIHGHGTEDRHLDSNLRIRETQSNHILLKEIEQLRSQLAASLKDQEHKHLAAVESLKHDLHLKEREFDHKLKQDEMDKEVEGTIRLANTGELSRAQQIQMLIDYGKKIDGGGSDFEKGIYRREVTRLQKELYGDEPSGMVGQAHVGQEPQGGNTPPESGSQSGPTPEPPVEPDTGTDSRFIN
jgi:hypothetical protein